MEKIILYEVCNLYFFSLLFLSSIINMCLFSAISKDVVIMNMHLKNIKLEFFGKDLSIKPTERTIKKFKCGRIYEL